MVARGSDGWPIVCDPLVMVVKTGGRILTKQTVATFLPGASGDGLRQGSVRGGTDVAKKAAAKKATAKKATAKKAAAKKKK